MIEQILLDMDGVLDDFVGGVCRLHNRPNPYDLKENFGKYLYSFSGQPGWDIDDKAFWAKTKSVEFWANLDKTQEADSLVETVFKHFGEENVAIITAPTRDAECIEGKRIWIAKHYPELSDRMIFTSAKQFVAAPNRLLIDDTDKNVDAFRRANGEAILVPRFWNCDAFFAQTCKPNVAEEIKRIARML